MLKFLPDGIACSSPSVGMQLLFSQDNLKHTNSYTNYVFIIIKVLNGEISRWELMLRHKVFQVSIINAKNWDYQETLSNVLGMEINSHILF